MAKINSTSVQQGVKKEMGFTNELIYGKQGCRFQSISYSLPHRVLITLAGG